MLSLYRLPHQIEGEKILEVIRRDLLILWQRFFICLLLIVLPLMLGVFFINLNPEILSGPVSYPVLILGASAYFLFTWFFIFFNFIDYYLDIWIITNERIIDVQQHGFFSRVIAEHRLDRIQDVTSEVHGILPTVFKYGEVYVQTAGAKQRFKFHQVPKPEEIRNTVIKLSQICREKHGLKAIDDNLVCAPQKGAR